MRQHIQRMETENGLIMFFIKNWRLKNIYDPDFLEEYNKKFETDFNAFLTEGDFLTETMQIFKS